MFNLANEAQFTPALPDLEGYDYSGRFTENLAEEHHRTHADRRTEIKADDHSPADGNCWPKHYEEMDRQRRADRGQLSRPVHACACKAERQLTPPQGKAP